MSTTLLAAPRGFLCEGRHPDPSDVPLAKVAVRFGNGTVGLCKSCAVEAVKWLVRQPANVQPCALREHLDAGKR